MTHALLNLEDDVVGLCDASYEPQGDFRKVPLPAGYTDADFEHLVFQGGALVVDPLVKLITLKATRIALIKQEAAALITATDWQLQRAKEREEAGWAPLADVDAILVQRECIRRSSDEAEALVHGLATAAEVQAFKWQVSVAVPAPHRVTHALFLDALETLGEGVIPAILAAVETNPALKKWWTYFDKAQVISGSDTRLQAGLQGLEIAGVLPPHGAQSVIDAIAGGPG